MNDFSVSVEYHLIDANEEDCAFVPGIRTLGDAMQIAQKLIPSDSRHTITRRMVTNDDFALIWDEDNKAWVTVTAKEWRERRERA